jgi:beta-lactamase class D
MRGPILLLTLALAAAPSGTAEDPALGELFVSRGVRGTMVIASLSGEMTYVHDTRRAGKRFSPASTFKIPHSLIALEERAIRDERDTLRWDGVRRAIPAWNRDQTLASAFTASCVWYYQEIARRVGMEKERAYLKALSYGNQSAGDALEMFWLDGSLQVSALEQIHFLRGVVRRTFPFSPRRPSE